MTRQRQRAVVDHFHFFAVRKSGGSESRIEDENVKWSIPEGEDERT